MAYRIFVESSADFTPKMLQSYGLDLVPLRLIRGDITMNNEEMDPKTFYDLERAGETMTTAAANVNDYMEAFEPHLKNGQDILLLGFTSGLSSSVNNAKMAAEELRETYPERKIYIIDTKCANYGQGLLADLVTRKKAAGATIDEAKAYAESIMLKVYHAFTVNDLMYLKRGGRISATTAVAGTVLGIKPILYVRDDGKIYVSGKARGRNASIKALYELFEKHAVNPKAQTVYISHADCPEDAERLAAMLKGKVKNVIIGYIGPVFGCHCGPMALSMYFLCDEREG